MNATFLEHFEELRRTLVRSLISLIVCGGLSLFFYKEIIQLLLIPLNSSGIDVELILLSPLDGILVSFKIAFWTGIVVSSPFWLYQLLHFLTPAFHPHEIRFIFPFAIVSFFFLCIGFFCAFFATIPISNQYLYTFNQEVGKNMWTFSEYLNFTILCFLAHLVAFETFAVLLFLVHFQLISVETMVSKRNYVIVGSFIMGAIFTPPDVFSQIVFAGVLLLFYELTLLYGRFRKWKRRSLLLKI